MTSGGIAPYARDGSLVSLDTRFALRDVGVHLEENAGARDLKRGHRHLLDEADLILTMTAEQIDMLRREAGESAQRALRIDPGNPKAPNWQQIADLAREADARLRRALERVEHG